MTAVTEIWADEVVSPQSNGGFKKLQPGRILFSQSKIIEVSRVSRAHLPSVSKKIIRAKVVTPGLVDCHTHLLFAGDRSGEWNERLKGVSYEEIARKGGGILNTVKATRAASVESLVNIGIKRSQIAMSFGVTTLEAKSGYGLDLKSEMKLLKAIEGLKKKTPLQIFSTFMGGHARPPEFKSNASYIQFLIKNILPKVAKLAQFQDVFCERGYFSEREAITLLNAGKKWGLLPKVHAHEFGRTGGVNAAAQVGAVSADHLMCVNDLDIQKLMRAKVIPVLLPGTSLFLGGKSFAPARKMMDAGLKVALATDFNPGTNPSLNLPLVGTFAAVFQNLNLEEILTAQTRHAALALRLSDRGCLDVNKRADLVLWDCEKFEEIYYSYGSSRVASVYLGGKKVF